MSFVIDDNGELLCPACKGSHLVHGNVEVFTRREDAAEGFHASVSGANVSVDTLLTGNPSNRRGGVLVHFQCEVCGAKPIMSIGQHKGRTMFEFG